eukprot:9219530-Pyramimonas_sp.AAC.1
MGVLVVILTGVSPSSTCVPVDAMTGFFGVSLSAAAAPDPGESTVTPICRAMIRSTADLSAPHRQLLRRCLSGGCR